MTSTDPAHVPDPAAAALRDVVCARHVLEDHHRHTGVVIDIFRRPGINADRYRVEFPTGHTEWHYADELTIQPWTSERDIVLTDLTAVRTILHHAITTAEGHHVLHTKLGDIFDALTTTAGTYLRTNVDTLPPAVTAE